MIGCGCEVCSSPDPRDNRLRSSVLIRHEGLSILIDAGPDFRQQMLRAGIRHIDAILLTHGHFDHVGAVEEIVKETGCKLWISESDWSQFPNPVTAYFYPIANCDFCEVSFCEDDEVIPAGGLTFRVLATPGHTHGSVCYLCENAMFSGDTLFAGSCGRTDLPGGSGKFLRDSLERLAELKDDYTVYPGHGESTTLAEEKRYNPYMR